MMPPITETNWREQSLIHRRTVPLPGTHQAEVRPRGFRGVRATAARGWFQIALCAVAVLLGGCGKRIPQDKNEALGKTSQAVHSGLVAAYGFEEGSGATTADASGNGLTGALTDPGWTRGKFGNALRFNGSTSWVTVDDAAALNLTTGMTLSAWVRPLGDMPTWPTVIMKQRDEEFDYVLYANSDNGTASALIFSGGENGVVGGPSVAEGTWTYLAATYSDSTLSLYVNGTLAATQAVGPQISTSTGPLRIGGNDIWGSEQFDGLIDEVRIYNRPLSATEIGEDMTSAVAPAGPPLPIVMGDDTILPFDDSGNGNLLATQEANLAEAVTIQSLKLYVTQAAGVLRMGIYDATGPNGNPGNKLAETNEITPSVGWTKGDLTSPVLLQPGTYWLVYLPSTNDLHIRRAGAGKYVDLSFDYAPLPSTYSTPTGGGSDHWSFYATGTTGSNGCTGAPAGTSCSDGNPCNGAEVCDGAGNCQAGTPVVCTALDQCHVAGTCDPGTGACSNPAKADGTSCNDGNACTQTDTCQSGSCTGSNPVTCTASDQCHVTGSCDPANGVCSNPIASNGTSCNDGNACTQTDTCQDGACAGSNSVTCTASDQCHVAGSCDPGTGACSNPIATNGTACDDGNACTQSDTCQAGSCTGGSSVTCVASDQCHVAGICNPSTGACSNPIASNGTACSDGNA
jgi:hypothetical protein